ncbi:hypothetical protein F5Y04DRAFT_116323 [Hypomontagnella monticulosa]|nr:hypothetical protein F5Y04DRAFT_116323 [Hypomontagnella monticulosa]
MSSTTGLSRMRSLRKPATSSNETTQRDGPTTRSEARNTSPSRLPVKPTMTTRSAATGTATSTTTTSRTRATSSTTGRPISGVYGKTSSSRLDQTANGNGNAATKPLGRAPSTRYPPSTATTGPLASMGRTTSTTNGRPRSSGGPPTTTSSSRVMGHSRSKSTVTSLTAATTLRPTSQISSGSSGRASPTTSTITSTSSTSKPVTRSQTHTRTKSQSATHSSTSSTAAATITRPTRTTTSTAVQPPSQQHTLTNRPAFNNHQQHYSPAKSLAPKPLTSTFLAPPSPSKLPANVALSAETSRLQTELLQLSLLHRDAPAVDTEWHASARAKLGVRFARAAADNESLLALERRGVEARNVAALARWGQNSGSRSRLGLEEKIQILDEVLNGVWALGEPGGRYARAVAEFEGWAERMAGIISAQRNGDVEALVEGEEVRFLGDLDCGWMHDCVSLTRKLEGWQAALQDLGDIEDDDSSSGLARMVAGCRALVHDMLAELTVMQQMEREAALAEDAWIESMNRAIEDENDDTPAARAYVPLWKMAT